MSGSPQFDVQYAALPTTNVEAQQPNVEPLFVKKSSRWVYFLCFTQWLMAIIVLLNLGNIYMMIVNAIFTTLGISGVRRQRSPMLFAHFIYSVILYILSLFLLVSAILYCYSCSILDIFFFLPFIIVQAVGMKHSRLLLCYFRSKNGGSCRWSCRSGNCPKPTETPITNQPTVEVQTQTPVASAPGIETPTSSPVAYPQFVVSMQPQFVQPMNQMRYPMMVPQGYPQMIPMVPMYTAPQPPHAPQQESAPKLAQYPGVPLVYRQ